MSEEIELSDPPDPAAREVILRNLIAYNATRTGALGPHPFALLIRNQEGELTGGLWARISWGWMFVELLFIPEDRRASGLGTRLMRRAEEAAIKRGCHHVWLDTFSFQARGFYEKLGYQVFGRLDDYPVGHSRFFMTKALMAPANSA